MHELAVTQNILNIALEKAREVKADKITRINVVVGELSGAVSDSMSFYFEILRKDTAAAAAVLDCVSIPAKLRCRDCGEEFHTEDVPWLCPKCGGLSVEVLAGQELFLESMEVS